MTIFEIGYLRRELKLNDVIRVGPYPIGIKPILFLVRRGKDTRESSTGRKDPKRTLQISYLFIWLYLVLVMTCRIFTV